MFVLLLAATILGLGGVTLGALVSYLRDRRRLALGLLTGGAAWTVLYATGLVAVSLGSREVVLSPGARKAFCGFYLDCHLGAAVAAARTVEAIGDLRPQGRFLIVTLRISSDARAATLRPYGLHVELLDAEAVLARVPEAEAALARLEGTGDPAPLERDVAPGGSYLVDVVFDVPADPAPAGAVAPRRLLVQEGWTGVDRLVEGVLIGDEDSFLHRKTLFALPS